MSYILDALKKAAEQRDVHAPAMRRLFTPDPEVIETPRWRLALLGGGAAFAGAAVVTLFWLLWPGTPVLVTEKADATPATTARVLPAAPAAVEPPPPAPPIVRSAPRPAAPAKAAPEKRSPGPAGEARRKVEPAPTVDVLRPPAETTVARPEPTPPSPPVIASLRPTPSIVPAPPPAAAPAARSEAGKPLRLEVIVYSEERARRLAFINGRKYVEGDTLLDGVRVQEIQPNAVVIIEDGRRVVLRP